MKNCSPNSVHQLVQFKLADTHTHTHAPTHKHVHTSHTQKHICTTHTHTHTHTNTHTKSSIFSCSSYRYDARLVYSPKKRAPLLDKEHLQFGAFFAPFYPRGALHARETKTIIHYTPHVPILASQIHAHTARPPLFE